MKRCIHRGHHDVIMQLLPGMQIIQPSRYSVALDASDSDAARAC